MKNRIPVLYLKIFTTLVAIATSKPVTPWYYLHIRMRCIMKPQN